MQQLLHGDSSLVFDVVYGLYQQQIEKYLVKKVDDQESAYELCQETFKQLWEFLCKETVVQTAAYYKNWLYKTAGYRAIDYLRSKKPIGYLSTIDSEAYTPEMMVEGVENRIDLICLQDDVAQLTLKQQVSLVADYRGYSQIEIAANLGISPAAVSMHVKRARAELRTKSYHPVPVDMRHVKIPYLKRECERMYRSDDALINLLQNEKERRLLGWYVNEMGRLVNEILSFDGRELSNIDGCHHIAEGWMVVGDWMSGKNTYNINF